MLMSDVSAVYAVQLDAYAEYFLESTDVIANRFNQSPATAWVAEYGGSVCAYLIGYWSELGKVNPLNLEFQPAKNTQCFYMHDLAILTSAQGLGLAKKLIAVATKFALNHNAAYMALLSVQNSSLFWKKNGFNEFSALSQEQKTHMMSYKLSDSRVFYMMRELR